MNNIEITRIWQEEDFFQVLIKCSNRFLIINNEVYLTNDCIDELINSIDEFLSSNSKQVYWESGEKGNASTECVSFNFQWIDKLGHIQIEVYMELNDGGDLETHNCSFFIESELGELIKFKGKLQHIKEPIIGRKISLKGQGTVLCPDEKQQRNDE